MVCIYRTGLSFLAMLLDPGAVVRQGPPLAVCLEVQFFERTSQNETRRRGNG